MAEERFTSQYDGTTQDNLLKFAENVKKATTVDGAETVNVQGFTLPRISDISGFVAVNNAGNAIGFMSKEQVASVLGGLMEINDTWFRYRGSIQDSSKEALEAANLTGMYVHGVGLYKGNGWHGILLVFNAANGYTAKIDLNMSNEGWSVKIWDSHSQTWR